MDLYTDLLMMQEACASCELENIPARFYDFYRHKGNSKNTLMASNTLKAMKHMQSCSFSESLIKHTHGILATSEIQERRFRDTQNLALDHMFQHYLTHPIPSSWIPTAIDEMGKYISDDNFDNGLIKAATVQYQLEVLSPFNKYSRIVARMLAINALKWTNLLSYPVLWLSDCFLDVNVEYKDRIVSAYRYDEDMLRIMWIKFFLLTVNKSARNSIQLIERLTDIREKHMAILPKISGGNKSAQAIYEYTARNLIVNARQISDALGLSFSGVTKVVNAFDEAGIIRQVTQKECYRQFGYTPVLDLIEYA